MIWLARISNPPTTDTLGKNLGKILIKSAKNMYYLARSILKFERNQKPTSTATLQHYF